MGREVLVVADPDEPLVVEVVYQKDEPVFGHEVALLHQTDIKEMFIFMRKYNTLSLR